MPTDQTENIAAMATRIYRDKVDRARRMSADEKFLAGYRLFQQGCMMMEAGIRNQFPDADDAEVKRRLHQRLQLGRKLENGNHDRIQEMMRGER